MTEQELAAIEARAEAAAPNLDFTEPYSVEESARDVPALVAEVRRLRGLLKRAEWAMADAMDCYCPWCGRRDDRGHEATCEAFPGGPPQHEPVAEEVDAGSFMARELDRLGAVLKGDTSVLGRRKPK